nr:vegetative cell wall protein gp1-like [Aegilops tauschii subsp. strangulata]
MDAVKLVTEGPPEGKEHRTPERYFKDVLDGSRIVATQYPPHLTSLLWLDLELSRSSSSPLLAVNAATDALTSPTAVSYVACHLGLEVGAPAATAVTSSPSSALSSPSPDSAALRPPPASPGLPSNGSEHLPPSPHSMRSIASSGARFAVRRVAPPHEPVSGEAPPCSGTACLARAAASCPGLSSLSLLLLCTGILACPHSPSPPCHAHRTTSPCSTPRALPALAVPRSLPRVAAAPGHALTCAPPLLPAPAIPRPRCCCLHAAGYPSSPPRLAPLRCCPVAARGCFLRAPLPTDPHALTTSCSPLRQRASPPPSTTVAPAGRRPGPTSGSAACALGWRPCPLTPSCGLGHLQMGPNSL